MALKQLKVICSILFTTLNLAYGFVFGQPGEFVMSQEPLACSAGADDSFGPWAGQCRGGFDFTLLFEESILTIPLQCLFLLVLPVRVVQLVKMSTKVIPSSRRLLKIVRCLFGVHTPLADL